MLCRFGWHGKIDYKYFDGASEHGTCRRCGYDGMIDSGGNLF